MAEQQRIHPTMVVASPKGSKRAVPPVKANPAPAPVRKRSNSLCKIMCWAVGLVLLLVVLVGATLGILFLVFRPKVPEYSVERLRISELRLKYDMSLQAKFEVKVRAENPNEKIGIHYYSGGSWASVWYSSRKLCEGALPGFYQGHRNVTRLDVSLRGESQYGATLLKALQQQQQTGRIPLDLKITAPVAVQLGTLKLSKVRVLGHCLLVVDTLTTNNFITIKTSHCTFRLNL